MQIAEIVHATVGVLFIAAMLGHIYIGTIGMEGAFEAMGEGTVDVNWAKQHHSLWLEDEMARGPKRRRHQDAARRIAASQSRSQDARLQSRAFCYKGAMRIIGLAGWSGSGKTTLITKLIPRLIARGLRVSTLKHAHHGFDLDKPGKDSFVHRAAGATEVIISSAKRWAILHELREEPEWDLAALVAKMSPVDLVLVEGFKRDAFPSWRSTAPPTASRCCIRTTRTSSRSPPTARCRRRKCRWSISTTSRRSPICCSSMRCRVAKWEPAFGGG